jgi:type VI protein secretion system component VasF
MMQHKEQDALKFADDIIESTWTIEQERIANNKEAILQRLQHEHRKSQQYFQWFKGAAAIVLLVNALALWQHLRSDASATTSATANTTQQWNSYYYHDITTIQ